jgi:hypothetical protein
MPSGTPTSRPRSSTIDADDKQEGPAPKKEDIWYENRTTYGLEYET